MKKSNFNKNYESDKQRKLIFTLKLAQFLVRKGFNMIDIEKHRTEDLIIFVFENTPELQNAINEYKQLKKAGKLPDMRQC